MDGRDRIHEDNTEERIMKLRGLPRMESGVTKIPFKIYRITQLITCRIISLSVVDKAQVEIGKKQSGARNCSR